MVEIEQKIIELEKSLYRIIQYDSNGTFVDSYLIIGESRALLIDVQRVPGNLKKIVKDLTDKPIDIVLTHAHYDHLSSQVFDFSDATVWIFKEELETMRSVLPDSLNKINYNFLHESQIFEIGGYTLEVFSISGHSPCGALLLEREKKWLFTGDAFGNKSFYMQIPFSTSLSEFLLQAERFADKIGTFCDIKIYSGHGIGNTFFDLDWLNGVIKETKNIILGELCGNPILDSNFGKIMCVKTDTFPDGYYYKHKPNRDS